MAEYLAYPVLMFATTPLFLHYLGAAQYGQWMFVLTLNGVGLIGGLGMGVAAIKHLSAARGTGDIALAERAAGTAILLTLLSSLALSAVIVVLAVRFGERLFSRLGGHGDVVGLACVAACLIAFEQLDGVYSGIMRAFERFSLAARIEITAKFGSVLGMAVVAMIARQLAPVMLFLIAATATRLIAKMAFSSRLLGRRLIMPSWDRHLAADIFRFGKWAWLQSIGGTLFAAADRLLVGGLLGAEALARYSVSVQLAQQIHLLPNASAQFIFPLVSRRAAEGGDVRRIALTGTIGIAAFAFALAIPILLFAHPILDLWVGREIADTTAVSLRLLTLAYLILGINVGAHFVLMGAGKARFVAVSNTIAGIVTVAIGIIAVKRYGLEGAALSRVAYGLIISSNFAALYALVKK